MAHMWTITFELHRMHSTSLHTDMTIEQSGLWEIFQIGGKTLALLASFTTLAMKPLLEPIRRWGCIRLRLVLTSPCWKLELLLFWKVGQGKGMHHKNLCQETSWWQQLSFWKKQAASFLKTNSTKSILATHHVLLLKASHWYKPVLGISDTSWPTMQHPSPGKHCKQLFCHKEVTITLLTA